ncbi:MAG: TetR/AcrR family transcriptional regulator [Acidimicrobiales bacterium]
MHGTAIGTNDDQVSENGALIDSGPLPDHFSRRTQIREAALNLFAERGYQGTSMEAIARRVGVRASSLYNHIDSKQQLLVEIMIATMEDLIADFEKATRTGDLVAKLRQAMEAHVRYHALHQPDVRVGNGEILSLEEPSRSLVVGLRSQYARMWQDLIEAGENLGVFRTPSAQLATYALLEMGIGVSLWYRAEGSLSLDHIAGVYGDMAVHLLGLGA